MSSSTLDHPWFLGTGNEGKRKEIVAAFKGLTVELLPLPDPGIMDSIEESGETIAENARIKAREISRQLNQYVLADDTGLFVDALDGQPGVLTARYAGANATAESNRAKLLASLEGIPLDNRTARFSCALALADPNGKIALEAEGTCEGVILEKAQGMSNFPYDPLFWIPEHKATLCQLDPETRAQLNHRTIAIGKLIRMLRGI